MIDDWEIKSWLRSAKDAVAHAIKQGEAGRAITLLDLIGRLERELVKHKKPDLPEIVQEEKEEPVPF